MHLVLKKVFTFMAVMSTDLHRAASGGTDEETVLHVRTTGLVNLRGTNQIQGIHEAVPLLALDRERSLSSAAELVYNYIWML